MKKVLYNLFRLLPIKKNKIIFFGYYGAQYGCNPKYISQYIVENEPMFKVVWGTVDPSSILNERIDNVKFASIKFWYEMATSKFMVTNYRLGTNMTKRPGQIYVQTWHSSLRLKKIEKDAESFLPEHYVLQAKKDSIQIDYLLSGCAESTRIFKNAFWYDGKILEIGTPRIDPIIQKENSELSIIKLHLGIKEEEKVLLYAPTFRKNNDYSSYLRDFTPILNSLEGKFGGNWKVVVRLHPHLVNEAKDIINSNRVINASSHNDIQELLMISDFLITDYSSLMFDFLYSKNPVILYLPDLEHYIKNERELYYDVNDLPFLKAYHLKDILEKIQTFEQVQYKSDLELFKKIIGSVEHGDAAKKLVKVLKEHIE